MRIARSLRLARTKARKLIPIKRTGVGAGPRASLETAIVSVAGDVGVAVDPPVAAAGTRRFVIFVEQMTRAPPPLAEPLHWLTRTPCEAGFVPLAVQVSWTRVPPPAEPLHCVIVAFVVVAGNGSQPVVMLPEPTHWFTVAAVAPAAVPTKLLVTRTLQRRVPPPPLIEPLHCVTWVTGLVRLDTWVAHVAGAPAPPLHSRTVTLADPPPPAKILLTTVTWQMRP